MTTTDTTTVQRPADYTRGLGEVIRAHRLYMGLSQRSMADRLGKDRRDYQRIENGRDSCPPGLLTQIEALSDLFCHQVDLVLAEAETRDKPLVLRVSTDPEAEWDRLVAGRAAVEAETERPILLTTTTMSGKSPDERSA